MYQMNSFLNSILRRWLRMNQFEFMFELLALDSFVRRNLKGIERNGIEFEWMVKILTGNISPTTKTIAMQDTISA